MPSSLFCFVLQLIGMSIVDQFKDILTQHPLLYKNLRLITNPWIFGALMKIPIQLKVLGWKGKRVVPQILSKQPNYSYQPR